MDQGIEEEMLDFKKYFRQPEVQPRPSRSLHRVTLEVAATSIQSYNLSLCHYISHSFAATTYPIHAE